MQKQTILKIYGIVQGVSFRYYSQRKAKELNLSGYVKNEPDETVKIVAEGEEKDLKELIEWCRNGSGYAKVEKVDVEWFPPTGRFNGFVIE